MYGFKKVISEILLLADNVTLQEPFYKWRLIENDPDNNKFADLAIAANAHYLVSNDKHLHVLNKKDIDIFGLQVVDLESFRIICSY